MSSTQVIPAELAVPLASLGDARNAIQEFIVNRGESFKVSHSDRNRYIVICRNAFCKFSIRAAVLKGPKVLITRYTPHSCSPIVHQNFRQAHSVSFLTRRHRAAVIDNREILPAQIRSTERIQYGNSGVNYQQAWRTCEALRKEFEGDEAECFTRMPGLVDILEHYDEDNYCNIQTTVDDYFLHCFVAPAATRTAWEACRPFIALDGCHTKSRFRMTLLVAYTLDGNNEILLLAWAVVPIEDRDNWVWFLDHMKTTFYGLNNEGMVVISDRDKGLQSAVPEVLPNVNHSHCCQHLADNIQTRFGLPSRNAFWKAAYTSNEHDFSTALAEIKEISMPAKEYIDRIPYESWAQYKFPAARFGHLTSNITESINASWDEYRSYPILRLFLAIWTKVMSTIHFRRTKTHKSPHVTDFTSGKLKKSYQQARRYNVELGRDGLAQVFVPNGSTYVIDLREKNCSCGEFQEYCIPCHYAVAVCLWQRHDPYDYIDTRYSIQFYREGYSKHMHLIREEDLVEKFEECQPPILHKQRGRPKKRRFRQEENPTHQNVCRHCGAKGHNRRSCRNAMGE